MSKNPEVEDATLSDDDGDEDADQEDLDTLVRASIGQIAYTYPLHSNDLGVVEPQAEMERVDRTPALLTPRRSFFINLIRSLGHRITEMPENSVDFAVDRWNYSVRFFEDDPQYVEIALPRLWLISDKDGYSRALLTANAFMASMRAVKVFVVDNVVEVTIEFYAGNDDSIARVFPGLLESLRETAEEFHTTMRAE